MVEQNNDILMTMNEFINDNYSFDQMEMETKIEIESDSEASPINSESTVNNLNNSVEIPIEVSEMSVVDGKFKRNDNDFATERNKAEGMMDIALLTSNANQLRFILTYNTESKTFYISLILVTLSLFLQIAVGIALIFKRQRVRRKRRSQQMAQINAFLVGGVFIVTVVNILLASFTTTDKSL